MIRFLAVAAPLVLATVLQAQTPVPVALQQIPRFTLEFSGLVASGPARVGASIADEGRRAALRGLETGSLDVYVDGVRLAQSLRLVFQTANSPDVIEAGTLAKSVVVRPEGITIVYSHPTFTVREHAFVPLTAPGAIIILEVATLLPLRVQLHGAEATALSVDSAVAATRFYVLVLASEDSVRTRLAERAQEYWQEKVAHFRKVRLEGASLETSDARVGQALDWAKIALARRSQPQNLAALIELGAFESARAHLINVNLSGGAPGADWVRGFYEYWLATDDDAFLRAYWTTIVRALRLPQPDTILAARLGALEGVQVMARALKDRTTAAYAAQQIARVQQQLANATDSSMLRLATVMAAAQLDAEPAERLLQRIGSSEYSADWGTRVLSRYDARYDPLRADRGAIVTYATGLVALANYRYHRPWAGFDLIRDVARETFDFTRGTIPPLLSGAYYQVLSAPAPAAFAQPVTYVSALLRGLLGWEVDAPNRAAALEPHLPAEWSELSASNLRVGHDRLDVAISRAGGSYSISLHRLTSGAPISLRVAPALPLGARVDRVTVNDEEVPVQSEESAHDVHAIADVRLSTDAEVEVHYEGGIEIGTPAERTEAGEASHELKVLDFRRAERDYAVTVEGVADASYALPMRTPWKVRAVQGSDGFDQSGARVSVRFTMPAGNGFVTKTLRVRVSAP